MIIKVSEEAVKTGGEIGGLLLASALSPVIVGVHMAETMLRGGNDMPTTNAILATSLEVGKVAGEFITRKGPELALQAMVSDLVGIALSWPGSDDSACA